MAWRRRGLWLHRFLMWSATPVGALAGGLLAGAYGLPTAVVVAALGGLAAAVWVYLPPVWRVREQPAVGRASA